MDLVAANRYYVIGTFLVTFVLMQPSPVSAQIFVTDFGSSANTGNDGSIGAYNLDGTPINSALISGLIRPDSIAASGTNLFVTKAGGVDQGQILFDVVAKYTTSGGTLNNMLISPLSLSGGIAVSGTNLYVSSGGGLVSKYTTSGTPINQSLVSDSNHLFSRLAVSEDGSRLFVTDADNGTVGEYDATTGVAINSQLITGLNTPIGIAVFGSHLYVGNSAETINGPNPGSGSIGEYNLDGSAMNISLISGLDDPVDLAVLNGNLFVLDRDSKSIGKYDATTGATINAHLVTGLIDPFGIAVVPEPSTIILACIALICALVCAQMQELLKIGPKKGA